MSKKKFRTKQAIDALEKCLQCENLSDEKKSEILTMLSQTKMFLQQQDDETPMADLSNCTPS